MAIHKNKFLLIAGLAALWATPALAEDYDALSHSDRISLSAGDATAANTAIQTPTPWPSYLNKTTIHASGAQGADLIDMYLKKYAAQQQSSPSTVININQPPK